MKINKKFLLCAYIFFYLVLFYILISFIQYICNYSLLIVFFLSLVINIFIIFFISKNKIVFYSILINIFFGLPFFILTNLNLFIKLHFIDICRHLIFYLIEYFVTANWLLPLIYSCIKEIKNSK